MVADAGVACRDSGSRRPQVCNTAGKQGRGPGALDRPTDRGADTLAGRQAAGCRRAGGRGPAALTAALGVSLGSWWGLAADVITDSEGLSSRRLKKPAAVVLPPHFDCRQHELHSQPIVQLPHYTSPALGQRQKAGRQQSRFATPAARSSGRRHVAQRHPVQVWRALWQPAARQGFPSRSFVLN